MEQWIEEALAVCETWKNKLSKASASDGAAQDFLSQDGGGWADVVHKTFGASARKAVLKVGNPTVRNRLLKSIVAIVDVTKRLPDAEETTGGPALALLQLHTELQRIESGLERFKRRSLSQTPVPGRGRKARSGSRKQPSEADHAKKEKAADKAPADEHKAPEDAAPEAAEAEGSGKAKPPARKRRGRRRTTLPPPSGKAARKQDNPSPLDSDDELVTTNELDRPESLDVPPDQVPMLSDEDVEMEASGPVIPIEPDDLIEEISEDGDTGPLDHEPEQEQDKGDIALAPEIAADQDDEENVQTLDGIRNGTNGNPVEEISADETDQLGESGPGPAPALASDEVEIHPVDLTDDSLLDQPVLPLKKRKEGSGLVRVDMVDVPDQAPLSAHMQASESSMAPQREILPEELNRLAGQDSRIALLETYLGRLRASRALTQKQSAILEQVVTLLGSALPHEASDLARTLSDLDRLYSGEEAPSSLPSEALKIIEQRMSGLLDGMRQALHEATTAADLQGLVLNVGPVTALSDASELPAAMLAIQLVESMSRWRLPADLLYVRGVARFFEVRIQANKAVALAWPIPENRLEFGLIGDLDEISVYALHLIVPSVDRPLGETATAGLPGAGVFYQISVPSDAGGASVDTVRTFALSETGRFLQALRRHVVRTT